MFDSVGWGEILVLIVAGLFILGPERLPGAAAWVGRSIRQVKEYASGARDQLRNELGPEFDELRKPLEELRGLRNFNPRAAATRAFFDDEPPVKPNGYAPGPNGAGLNNGGLNGGGLNGGGLNSTGPDLTKPAKPSLAKNELPPIDDDAT